MAFSCAARSAIKLKGTRLLEKHAARRQLQGFVRQRGGLSHSAFFILLAFAFTAKFAASRALVRPRLYPELQFLIPELLLLRLE
jgi:hypothetical protein